MITLKLLALLKEYAPNDGRLELEHTPGMTVADALKATEIEKVNFNYTILVNSIRKKPDDVLEDGDTVIVMSLLAGG